MKRPALAGWLLLAGICGIAGSAALRAATPEPLVYTIRIPDPARPLADVEVRVPTEGRERIELFMATWSPGYYRVEHYARLVLAYSARTEGGLPLAVGQPQPNRWTVETGGAPRVIFSYRLSCPGGAVTANVVRPELGLFNGPATFVTLKEPGPRPAEVRLELPFGWASSATSLDPAPGGQPNRYVAPSFDVLADSPLVAGALLVHRFSAGGTPHELIDFGAVGPWDGAAAAEKLRAIADEHRRFLGGLPFRRYVFLNAFRQGRGGLEHLNSTLLSANGETRIDLRWLNYVSHEYFHAFNVKRLRPVELGPFDYENPPSTPSLWFAEGVTTYFARLAVARAGLATPAEFLQSLSAPIRTVQGSPGRLVQTLSQVSLSVWTESTSGIGGDATRTVSYYDKGDVLGFLLDARIQSATKGARTFGDAFRLAYRRYGSARGFTPDELAATLSEVAATVLRPFLDRALDSTEELDYHEALDWFGLRFAANPTEKPETAWTLEARPDATPEQRRHFARLLAPSPGPNR